MIGPTLETERLILRPPAAEDFEAFAAFSADERTAKFVGGVMARTVAWRAWCTIAGAWPLYGFSMFSVIEKQSGLWVGRVGPWQPEGWPGTEVGWGIALDAQRKGYGKEAAAATIDWAFDALGWTEVIHCIDPLNAPSIALAHSLGSALLRRDVPAPAPLEVRWDLYGQTRAQWQQRRG
jgi:RimJ/RimL family protein N-acetyltransferase